MQAGGDIQGKQYAIADAVLVVLPFLLHKWVRRRCFYFGAEQRDFAALSFVVPRRGSQIFFSSLIRRIVSCCDSGAKVWASDISDAIATVASRRSKEMGITNAQINTSDSKSVNDVVTCVDVAIHYPAKKMAEMTQHLCSLSNDCVLISFAPKT